jgi:hypothetical protein
MYEPGLCTGIAHLCSLVLCDLLASLDWFIWFLGSLGDRELVQDFLAVLDIGAVDSNVDTGDASRCLEETVQHNAALALVLDIVRVDLGDQFLVATVIMSP